MIEFLILLFLSTFFAYQSKSRLKYGLELAFVLIIIFASLRYDYGNDYLHYLEGFEFHNTYTQLSQASDLRTEIGWLYLCFLFKDLGFYWLIAVLTIIEQTVMYYFIKKYVDKDVYWIAVFVYLIYTGLFLTGLSMIRQAAAISLCMIGYEFSIRRRLLFSLAMIIIASLIHISSLFTLPFVLLFYFFYGKIKISKGMAVIITIAIICVSIFSRFLPTSAILSIIGTGELDRYSGYISVNMTKSFGITTMVFYFMAYMVLTYQKQQNTNVGYFILLFVIGCFIEALGTSIYLIDRIALYFTYLMPVCYSMTFKKMRSFGWYPLFLIMFILLKLYNYNSFVSSGWGETFRYYHTIFNPTNIL